ncbi:ABC transporter transmembrane domain-containing protein [Halodurantibacterium flavum]|uniref:ABC transporter transmembrane domain-containing protein n=1 Tax=Halodurantibacterium flavum TaxID=1382802 RepID=A0ABW4S1L3_9RHOB
MTETSLLRYIWTHTRREQIVILLVVAISMIPYFVALNLPKQIVNGPLQGQGFEQPGDTQAFLQLAPNLHFLGTIRIFEGFQLDRVQLLVALCLSFLALVLVNGLFKYYINLAKGRMGERLLRRFRFELLDRVLRFPPERFRQTKAGEVSSMIKDEAEPLGGFSGDAFVQPALLGGQALTALTFIFIQHFWLGVVAMVMAVVQVAIILRMRRRLLILNRRRQLTARELAGHVTEVVNRIHAVHVNDASNWERANVAARLGRIYGIRYDIYRWKFLVKFFNNFIAKLTPFLFYLFGGYLTIQGSMDLGQLIAVINAYRELPGPLKELIDWDLARQDTQVRYDQVMEQFQDEGLIDPLRQDMDATTPEGPLLPLVLEHVSVKSDLGNMLLDDICFEIPGGETVALVGDSRSGATQIGELVTGLVTPSFGHVALGSERLDNLPERVTGRAIGYVSGSPNLLPGTILENTLYGLRQRPNPRSNDEGTTSQDPQEWDVREARRTGNPVFDKNADWIDYGSVQPPSEKKDLLEAALRVMQAVEFDGDLITIAAFSKADLALQPTISDGVLQMRRAVRQRLQENNLSKAMLSFEREKYNDQSTIGENLLFGLPTDPKRSIDPIVQHPFFRDILIDLGLAAPLFDLGWSFARVTLDLFAEAGGNPDLLRWLAHVTPEDLPVLEQVLARTSLGGLAAAQIEDRVSLIRLAMRYVEPNHRMNLLSADLRERLVVARNQLDQQMPEELRGLLQPYCPNSYMRGASLVDNVLFGKIDRRVGNAEERITEIVQAVFRDFMAADKALRDGILGLGLAYDIGVNGQRLSQLQRQKLALARVLLRRSALYVFDEPLAGIDPAYQERLMQGILQLLGDQPDPPAVIWILANAALAHHFSRTILFSGGKIVSDTGGAGSRQVTTQESDLDCDYEPSAKRGA